MLLAGVCAEAASAVPTIDQVWNSIAQQRAEACASLVPIDVYLEYTTEWHEGTAPALLAELRARVANKPDHPDLPRLARIEQYLAEGPKRLEIRLWVSPDGIGRECREITYGSMGYWDLALGRNAAWMMSDRGLAITSTRAGMAPSQHDAASGAQGAISEARDFFYGPMRFFASEPANRDQLQVDGREWVLRFPVEGRTCELRGVWEPDQKGGRALAQSARLSGPTDGNMVVGMQAEGWLMRSEVSRWMPSVVQLNFGDNDRFEAKVLRTVSLSSVAEIEAITQVPTSSKPDGIRGAPAAGTVTDYRSGSTVGTAGPTTLPTQSRLAEFSWLHWLSLALAAVVVVALVWNRVFGSRSHAAQSRETNP